MLALNILIYCLINCGNAGEELHKSLQLDSDKP